MKICHQSDREAWLAARKAYCTASEVVVAMGKSKYQTREELVLSKLGLWQREQMDDESRDLGLMLEDALAALVRKRWGWPLVPFGWLVEDSMCKALAATPDCTMLTPFGPAVVDLKVTSAQAQEQCKPGSTAKFANGCPEDFALQLQCQMACLGREYKYGAVLVLHCAGGFRMRSYCVRRSESVINEIRGTAQSVVDEVRARRGA